MDDDFVGSYNNPSRFNLLHLQTFYHVNLGVGSKDAIKVVWLTVLN